MYCGKCGYMDHNGAKGSVCPSCGYAMTMIVDESDIEYAIMMSEVDEALEWVEV